MFRYVLPLPVKHLLLNVQGIYVNISKDSFEAVDNWKVIDSVGNKKKTEKMKLV